MLATVQTTKAPTPFTDDMRKEIDRLTAEARKHDGLETTLLLADPATGEGLVVNLFRDQKALDSFKATAERLTKEAERDMQGTTVGDSRTYEVLTH